MISSTLHRRMGKRQFFCLAVLSGAVLLGGCTRAFYRNQADKQMTALLEEKDVSPESKIEQYHVYPDPRARFADQTCPDRPPMPEDDPAARKLSPHPQNPGKDGIANIEGEGYLELLATWDRENRAEAESAAKDKTQSDAKDKAAGSKGSSYTSTAINIEPKPGQPLPYLLKLEQAVELGIINAREYQDAREDLYLTALPVSVERFAFAPQFFAFGQALREFSGSQTSTGEHNDWRVSGNGGVAQLFTTGALLLVNFANQTVINLTGAARGVTSQSTIDLDLVQPFLRGGGLAVTLEPLTQAERNLVYQIRNFARFRKEFYVAIAGGGGGSITGASFQPINVVANPSFSPTQGLGNSGLVPGSIAPILITGNPSLRVIPGQSGNLSLQTALNAPVSGYLSTLLEAAQVQVDKYNIEKLEDFLRLAKAMQEGGDISQLQTDQFEQALLRGRISLLNDQQDYLQTIDQFKLQLGIPPHVPIALDDAEFRPLNRHIARYEELFREYKVASEDPLRFGKPELVAKVRGEMRRILTTLAIVQGTPFRATIEAQWTAWEKLTDDALAKRLADFKDERRKLQDKQTDLDIKGQALNAADQKRLDTLNVEIDLGDFERVLRDYEKEPWKNLPDPAAQRRQQQSKFSDVVPAMILVLTQARNERMKQLHDQWPKLKPLCVKGVDLLKADLIEAENVAAQYGLANRLDLMNVRGQVVDAWRQLAIFANALMGTLNVQYHMDTTTPPLLAEPFAFSGSRSHQQLILNTELPLVRIEERNNYRASLINYQRARRILQRAEDEVQYDVRQELILLRQQYETYLIQERQIELAYMTVENALDTLQAPLQPLLPGQAPPDTATRAAALTNQLINAQSALYTANFQMTSIWITYLNTRQELYRDMELMPLDARGVWIDNVATCECPQGDQNQDNRPTTTAEPAPAVGEQLPPPRLADPVK